MSDDTAPLSKRSHGNGYETSAGAAPLGGAVPELGPVSTDAKQCAALLEFMRVNELKVSDVLRLCARVMDEAK